MRRSIILSYFQFLSDEAKKCKNGPNDFLKGRSGHFELKLARGGFRVSGAVCLSDAALEM